MGYEAALPASEHIRALASGYAPRHRTKKLLLVLQAYIDESASESGDKRLVMAGYVSSVPEWERFSDDWDCELRRPPSIDYLRMVEAEHFRGQFCGWPEEARDRKLLALAQRIPGKLMGSIHTSVSRSEYLQILAPIAPYPMKQPYSMCFHSMIGLLPRLAARMPDPPTIDFIFDENNLGPDNLIYYQAMKDVLPERARALLSGPPIFRDDKKVVALQAADMLAWHLRKRVEDRMYRPLMEHIMGVTWHAHAHLDAALLKAEANRISKIPGVRRIQTRNQWRRLKRNIKLIRPANIRPNTNRIWMHLLHAYCSVSELIARIRYRRRR